MKNALFLTLLCGIGGVMLGGIIGIKTEFKKQEHLAILLSMSAGLMLVIAVFELALEASEILAPVSVALIILLTFFV